jgi:cellulose synthase/poly-beta-1,6-N-acetylglucosamine synthase-like glycosyltransferase
MKITVFSLWRDSEPYIDKALSNIKALEANNKEVEFEYYFYENDSEDNTKKILEEFLQDRKGKFISEDLGAVKFGSTIDAQRMKSMAKYRNNILYTAKPMDSDYCIIWDSDVDFEPDILNNFLKYKDEGAMLCPNIRQNVPCVMGSGDNDTYYDSLSLVDKYGIQCMTWASNPFYDEQDRAKYEEGLPIEVTSAFGGFVLIRTELLNKEGIEWFSRGALEHWGLCARIKDIAKEKIIFLPSIRVQVQIPKSEIDYHKASMESAVLFQEERMRMSSWERQLISNDIREGYV